MPKAPRSSPARSAASPARGVRGRLQLERNGASFLAPARVDLLEAIGEHGSITRAAQAVGLSYKAAWDAVDAMNNLAAAALVHRAAGGARGGGTTLTDYGRHVVALVRAIERDHASLLATLDEPGSALSAYARLQRQLSLRTSARNQWIGRLDAIARGAVRSEVRIALAPDLTICADVSTESARRLALRVGEEVCALVKATSVALVAADRKVRGRTQQTNRIPAQVALVRRGGGHMEVTARMAGERTITAVCQDAADGKTFARGQDVVASFGPAQVTLVRLG